MSSLKEMVGIKPKVKHLLVNFPHLRDDDNKLIANIWYNEVDCTDISASTFLKFFSDGILTSPESIRRMRQKLQEENEELRGKNYKLRHKEKDTIRKNINKD